MLRLPFSLCAGRNIYILNCSFIKLSSDYWDLPISSLWQCDYLTAAKWYLFLITSQCSKIMISSHKGIHFSLFSQNLTVHRGVRQWTILPWDSHRNGFEALQAWKLATHKRNLSTKQGPKSPPWCQRRYGKEDQNRSFMTSIVALNRGCFFFCIFYLPAGSIQENRQKERLAEKREISFSDLGGFVEQQRGNAVTKSKMPSLLPRKTKRPPSSLPVLLSQFSTQSNQVERLSEALPRSGPGSGAIVRRCLSFVVKLEVFLSLQTFSSLFGDWSFLKDKGDAKRALVVAH